MSLWPHYILPSLFYPPCVYLCVYVYPFIQFNKAACCIVFSSTIWENKDKLRKTVTFFTNRLLKHLTFKKVIVTIIPFKITCFMKRTNNKMFYYILKDYIGLNFIINYLLSDWNKNIDSPSCHMFIGLDLVLSNLYSFLKMSFSFSEQAWTKKIKIC